jgi:DNA-binding IclR family transcriptional regulator
MSTREEVKMLRLLAKFGSVHPIAQTDIERLESLQAAGYVVKDPRNPMYSLTVRGWAFVRKAAGTDE